MEELIASTEYLQSAATHLHWVIWLSLACATALSILCIAEFPRDFDDVVWVQATLLPALARWSRLLSYIDTTLNANGTSEADGLLARCGTSITLFQLQDTASTTSRQICTLTQELVSQGWSIGFENSRIWVAFLGGEQSVYRRPKFMLTLLESVATHGKQANARISFIAKTGIQFTNGLRMK